MLRDAVRFFAGPRPAMRALLDRNPSESQLFGMMMVAVLILIAGGIAVIVVAPEVRTRLEDARLQQIAAEVAATLVIVPLVFYAMAAIGTLMARGFGGEGGWRAGRAALFLAALVSAPFIAFGGVLNAWIALPPVTAAIVSRFGSILFAWAIAQCFAEAFGFRRTWLVFAVLAGAVLFLVGVLWWLAR